MMNYLNASRARIAGLVRRALRRSLQRIAAALRLASRLAAVVALATYQRAAVTAWRWHRVAACSNSGPDSRRRTDKQERSQYNRRRTVAA